MGKETQCNSQKKPLENIFVSSEQRFLKQDAKSTDHWEETDKGDFIKMKDFVQRKRENPIGATLGADICNASIWQRTGTQHTSRAPESSRCPVSMWKSSRPHRPAGQCKHPTTMRHHYALIPRLVLSVRMQRIALSSLAGGKYNCTAVSETCLALSPVPERRHTLMAQQFHFSV